MQAILKQKNLSQHPINGAEISISLGFDMPNDVQDSLDRILQYYRQNNMRPQVSLQGDPLDITSGLVSQVQATLPLPLQDAGKSLLDFLIQEIVNFCREKKVQSLSLNFVFESGRI